MRNTSSKSKPDVKILVEPPDPNDDAKVISSFVAPVVDANTGNIAKGDGARNEPDSPDTPDSLTSLSTTCMYYIQVILAFANIQFYQRLRRRHLVLLPPILL